MTWLSTMTNCNHIYDAHGLCFECDNEKQTGDKKMFTLENTEGYTQAECDDLNAEFEERFLNGDWTDDRDQSEKWFNDEVAKR